MNIMAFLCLNRLEIPVDELCEVNDPMQPILKAIYAPDPVTKLPTGDIMCYMASNTPSRILKNLS